MAEEQGPVTVRSITSYDAASTPPPPPPLPVPPRKRMPRWAFALIAGAVALALLLVVGFPVWIVASIIRGAGRTGGGELPATYPSSESTIVAGAYPDVELRRTIARDYPDWRYLSGSLRERRWHGGGLQTWTMQLEDTRHELLIIEVEYERELDREHKPDGAWTTDEDFFNRAGNQYSSALLDRLERDIDARPLVIDFVYEEATAADGRGRVFEVTWEQADSSAQGEADYVLDDKGRWAKAPPPPASTGSPVADTEVPGAKMEPGLRRTCETDYPAWTVRTMSLRRERWEGGGTDVWKLRLESKAHAGIFLDVVYSKDTGGATARTGEWSTSESILRTTARYGVSDRLLEMLAADVAERPLIIGVQQDMQPAPGTRAFRIDYRTSDEGERRFITYVQGPGATWSRR